MTQIPFDPNADILIFRCRVEYESIITLYLALDTGASNVIISREAAINIGYNLKLTPDQTTISDVSTSHLVPILTLKVTDINDIFLFIVINLLSSFYLIFRKLKHPWEQYKKL